MSGNQALASAAPLIDCDVHPVVRNTVELFPYMSREWQRFFQARGLRTYARARDRYNHPNTTCRMDAIPPSGGPAGSDFDYAVADHLDPFGIASALLLPQEPYGVTAGTDDATADVICEAVNRHFLDTWVSNDDRFRLAVSVSAHDPSLASKRIRALAKEDGVVGVQLLLLEQMMGSRWFDPIYEVASETQLPIVFHQSGNEGCYVASQSVAGGAPRSYGERHAVLTQVGAANVVDLIVSGTFERFPSLQVVLVEWGFSWLEPLMSRMDAMWKQSPQDMPLVKMPPSEYALRHLTFTTQPLDEPDNRRQLKSLFDPEGWDQMLLFSSDYPHYDTDDPEFVFKRIPESIRPAVAHGNALRVFGEKIIAGA